MPDIVSCPGDADPVHRDPLGLKSLQMQVDAAFGPLSLHQQAKMRFFAAEADHFLVSAAPVGSERCALVDGFQNIRLSLGVVSEKEVDARAERKAQLFVIPVFRKLQQAHDHLISISSPL